MPARLPLIALLLLALAARVRGEGDPPPSPPPAGDPPAPAAPPVPPTPAPPSEPKPPPAPKPFAGRDTEAVKAAFPGQDREVLEQPERLELVALHPYPGTEDGTPARREDAFQGHKVLGRAEIKSAEERRELVEALYKCLNEPYGPAAGCFNPRHALRAVKGERTIDCLLCFECETLAVHSPSFTGEAYPAGKAILRIARSTEGPWDAALKRHKLPKHVDPAR